MGSQRPTQVAQHRLPLQAGGGPGTGAAGGGQPLVDEQGAVAVLDGDAATDQGLAVGDQGAPLPGLQRRDDDGGQLAQGVQLGQAQGVVAVGLACGVFELPGLGGGVGDLADQATLGTEVVDPAGQGTGLDDDDVGPELLEELAEVVAVGGQDWKRASSGSPA